MKYSKFLFFMAAVVASFCADMRATAYIFSFQDIDPIPGYPVFSLSLKGVSLHLNGRVKCARVGEDSGEDSLEHFFKLWDRGTSYICGRNYHDELVFLTFEEAGAHRVCRCDLGYGEQVFVMSSENVITDEILMLLKPDVIKIFAKVEKYLSEGESGCAMASLRTLLQFVGKPTYYGVEKLRPLGERCWAQKEVEGHCDRSYFESRLPGLYDPS